MEAPTKDAPHYYWSCGGGRFRIGRAHGEENFSVRVDGEEVARLAPEDAEFMGRALFEAADSDLREQMGLADALRAEWGRVDREAEAAADGGEAAAKTASSLPEVRGWAVFAGNREYDFNEWSDLPLEERPGVVVHLLDRPPGDPRSEERSVARLRLSDDEAVALAASLLRIVYQFGMKIGNAMPRS